MSAATFDVLARRLGDLPEAEKRAIRDLPFRRATFAANDLVLDRGADRPETCVLLHGTARRERLVHDGRRQIFSFHIPGDVLGLTKLLLGRMEHDVVAVTACEVAFVEEAALTALIRQSPGVATALWRDTLTDANVFQEWIVNIARRPAAMRIAHLICEIRTRTIAAGLASDPVGLQLDLSPEDIGDALALNVVHVTRVLHALRDSGHIELAPGSLRILEPDALTRAAEFSADYLNIRAA